MMYMAKRFAAVFTAMSLFLTLNGCGGIPGEPSGPEEPSSAQSMPSSMPDEEIPDEGAPEDQETGESGSGTVTNAYGSYTVPDGWSRADQYSTPEKVFYIADGTTVQAQTNNISVETGTNRYAQEDHMQFRDAIVRQLSMQLQGEDITVEGNGSFTDQGYVLYTFALKFPEDSNMKGAAATQHYIVGDQRYVMVYETAWGDTAETDAVARTIVNSFTWTDEA